MFFRMIKGAFFRQKGKMLMIMLTIALGASLATAMFNVMLDVGDKVNEELKTYGANITVVPESSSVVNNLYDIEGSNHLSDVYLREDELGNIKNIFWANNIVDYAPLLDTKATANGKDITLVGTWFNHHMDLPNGATVDAGISSMRSWWDIQNGQWIDEQNPDDANKVMIGTTLADSLGVSAGDTVTITGSKGSKDMQIGGVYYAGGDEDNQIYAQLDTVQALTGTDGKVSSVDVSAITTPDNELSRQAAKDPSKLTIDQYEAWYCTAYVSSICYQIQEVVTGSTASAVRQVAESEGAILEKTQLLMVLITIMALVGSALGISNLVTASVIERSPEIGLMKAVGASDRAVSALVLTETIIIAIIGGVIGYFIGFGFAQIIGQTVFGSAIEMKAMVIPIVAVLVILVTLAGSIPAIRTIQRMEPAEVLHGGR